MEPKQFTSDELDPHSNQGFQTDRFVKKTTLLSIPDTIPENYSAELSGDSLKVEVPKVISEAFNDIDKKSISSDQLITYNESLNTSSIIAIDNSHIKQCEKKLLENSNSEDDNSIENKSLADKHLLRVPRMSAYSNDTISTPPSALRKEISLLRNEMAEAHEFHDFEIKLLKEEKLQNEEDFHNYSEIISQMTEKYTALMELYKNLKTEYEDYRTKQEQMRQEMQSKTADCLESLCSQIEASDNSLNFSCASFVSFNGGIRSSTMMEDATEVEATILHDATVLANDPLSITNDSVFKTPSQTPLKSAKKLFPLDLNEKPDVREVKEIIARRDPFDSEYNIQLLNLETALYDKIKEVEDLEQRLFKVEDLSSVLQSEFERITTQNNTLKESLSKKTDELNELTQKLFTETISLNPSVRDSLVDIPGTKLLFVFIETIMESCRKIQAKEVTKHNTEKAEWEAKSKADAMSIENLQTQLSFNLTEIDDLKKKLSQAENTVLTRDEEILRLQSHVSGFRQTLEDFASSREALSELESKLTLTEAEKAAAENRYRELETIVENLQREIESNKNIQVVLEEENSKMKNEIESHDVSKFELMTVKEKLTSAEEAVEKLKSQIMSIKSEKLELENRFTELENIRIENDSLTKKISEIEKTSVEMENRCVEFENIQIKLKSQIESLESDKLDLENRCTEFENIRIENHNLKQYISEINTTSEELKSQIELLNSKKSELEKRCLELENDNLKQRAFESEKLELENRCTELQDIRIENETLKQRILEIEKASEEIKSQVLTLDFEKSELENRRAEFQSTLFENDNLKQRISESEKTSEELKSQVESLESEKLDLENRCTKLENIRIENDNLKQLIFEAGKTSEELKSQIESLEYEKLELENRCEALENILIENDNLKKRITESEKTSEKLKSQIESLEFEKLELENRCEALENIRIENNNFKQRISESEKTSEELKFQLESLESEKCELENRCTELQNLLTENDNLKQLIFEAGKRSQELKSQIESLEYEKLELENRCSELQSILFENDNLKQRISESEKTSEELKFQLESLESEKCELENRCTELQNLLTENDNLKQLIFEAGKRSQELKSQVESLEYEKLELENRCEALENIRIENNNFKQRIIENEKASEELESRVKSLEFEKLELENRCEALENFRIENDDLKQRIFEIQKTSEELKSQLESLESEKCELENRCTELQNLLTENDNLKQQVFESEKLEIESHSTELENIRIQNEDLKRHVLESEKTSEELKSRVESLVNEKLELESRYAALENIRIENEKTSAELETRCLELQEILTENDNLKRRIFECEKMELENRCTELENFRIENENLKQRVLECEEVMKKLKTELELKKEEEVKNVNKIEDLFSEIDQLKKYNDELTDAVEETQNRFTNLLSGSELNNSELPSERITKLVENPKFKEIKIVSVFVQTVRKTCEGVESELLRNFDSKKLEWETEKDHLNEQLTESRNEKENLLKLQEAKESQLFDREKQIKILREQREEMKNQLEVTQNQQRELVENLKREIKTKETKLSTMEENLTSAEETILSLKSQIKSFEVEKTQLENRYTELENSNNNSEKIQTENDDLKQRIFHSEKMLTELQNELEAAKEDQKSNISKVAELIREIEELKKENNGFSLAVEETRNLADMLSEDANDSDLPGDRITKLIAKTSKAEAKIVSDFVETITKTCKGVQNEMIRKFDSKKLEWETQKGVDLQNLQQQIKIQSEKNKELEAVVGQTKSELTVADEVIAKLKSQLTSAENEKAKSVENLKIEIDTKETIIKGLDEMKVLRENENCYLKKELQETEDVMVCLKKRLTTAEEELNVKEAKMQELLKEIDSSKKEMDFITQKLEKVEKSNRNLMEILSDVQTHLNISDDSLMDCENKKIISEKINAFVKAQLEGLETENKNLKIGNENLKEEIKQLTKLIGETQMKNANVSHPNSRTKTGKNIDLCVRRLDKLEEINHNLTELLTRVLTMTEFADLEKLKLCSVREFPNVVKKVVAHVNELLGRLKEMKEENGQLDEECETYANIIKDLKKEAAAVWKDNKEKTEAFEAEVRRLKEERDCLMKEKEDLAGKISKLNEENLKLKSKTEGEAKTTPGSSGIEEKGTLHICSCGNESKKINELKRAILVKEQKLLELQDLEAQTSSHKSQIEYLKTALEREKKKVGEEKEKNKKLQNELNEATKHHQKVENKKPEENQVLDELRMRGSISGGIVQEFVDKEKMRKLSKDIGILKELCRARYAEIKRLEAVNAALRNGTPKNSNQMDSPIRSRGYNTRSKNQVRDFRRTEIIGKENSAA